jgi:hypothetical protein
MVCLLASASQANAQSDACTSITNEQERLACYDAANKRGQNEPVKTAPSGLWRIVKEKDPLSGKVLDHAESPAAPPFIQDGQAVTATLIAYCSRLLKGDPAKVYTQFWFSQSVAYGRVWVRTRVDDRAVETIHPNSHSRGQAIDLFFLGRGIGGGIGPMGGAKRLRAELDLPKPGKVLLEFPLAGAKEAVAKLTCRDPEF